jgi:hypothetical protein
MKYFLAALLGIVVVVIGSSIVRHRACDAGLSTCDFGLFVETLEYHAAHALKRNHILQAADLKSPDKLPAGARRHLPPNADLVGQYVREDLEAGTAISAANLSRTPVVADQEEQCLALADPGAYASSPGSLSPGRAVTLACRYTRGDCAGAGEWKVVAMVDSKSDGSGDQVLVTADPARCDQAAALIVINLPRGAP